MALGAFGLTQNSSASDLTITTAGTTTCNPVTGLTGMQALTVFLKLAYGSGGSTVKVYVQTSMDSGNTWFDVACAAFGTASESVAFTLSGMTPRGQTILTDGTLADDSVVDGILGDRVRLKVISSGTYANSTVLVGRMVAK